MTTSSRCATCTYWARHRADANWGECSQINDMTKLQGEYSVGAYIHTPPSLNSESASRPASLHTRDVFDCAMWEEKIARTTGQ